MTKPLARSCAYFVPQRSAPEDSPDKHRLLSHVNVVLAIDGGCGVLHRLSMESGVTLLDLKKLVADEMPQSWSRKLSDKLRLTAPVVITSKVFNFNLNDMGPGAVIPMSSLHDILPQRFLNKALRKRTPFDALSLCTLLGQADVLVIRSQCYSSQLKQAAMLMRGALILVAFLASLGVC